MLSLVIWRLGMLLHVLLLLRGCQSKLVVRYPYFYAQVACGFATDIIGYVLFGKSFEVASSPGYTKWYWVTHPLCNFILCGCITAEILKHSLSSNPGAKRFAKLARLIVIAVIFCFAALRALVMFGVLRVQSTNAANICVERDFRGFEAVIILSIIGAIFYFGSPIGTNMKGMTLGYGFLVGGSLVSLALFSYDRTFVYGAWYYVPPLSWIVAMTIWLITLWDYHPDPAPQAHLQVVWDRSPSGWSATRMMGAVHALLARPARS